MNQVESDIADIKIVLLALINKHKMPNEPEMVMLEQAIKNLGIDVNNWGKHTGL